MEIFWYHGCTKLCERWDQLVLAGTIVSKNTQTSNSSFPHVTCPIPSYSSVCTLPSPTSFISFSFESRKTLIGIRKSFVPCPMKNFVLVSSVSFLSARSSFPPGNDPLSPTTPPILLCHLPPSAAHSEVIAPWLNPPRIIRSGGTPFATSSSMSPWMYETDLKMPSWSKSSSSSSRSGLDEELVERPTGMVLKVVGSNHAVVPESMLHGALGKSQVR